MGDSIFASKLRDMPFKLSNNAEAKLSADGDLWERSRKLLKPHVSQKIVTRETS